MCIDVKQTITTTTPIYAYKVVREPWWRFTKFDISYSEIHYAPFLWCPYEEDVLYMKTTDMGIHCFSTLYGAIEYANIIKTTNMSNTSAEKVIKILIPKGSEIQIGFIGKNYWGKDIAAWATDQMIVREVVWPNQTT
jgi:hypothetical protein